MTFLFWKFHTARPLKFLFIAGTDNQAGSLRTGALPPSEGHDKTAFRSSYRTECPFSWRRGWTKQEQFYSRRTGQVNIQRFSFGSSASVHRKSPRSVNQTGNIAKFTFVKCFLTVVFVTAQFWRREPSSGRHFKWSQWYHRDWGRCHGTHLTVQNINWGSYNFVSKE